MISPPKQNESFIQRDVCCVGAGLAVRRPRAIASAGTVLFITMLLRFNCYLLPGSLVILSELPGTSTADGILNLEVSPPEFQLVGGWEEKTGILRLTSLGTKTINAYTIIFNALVCCEQLVLLPTTLHSGRLSIQRVQGC